MYVHIKCRFPLFHPFFRHRLPAVMTVEASYVLSFMLLGIAFMIRRGFALHDTVVCNAVLNEAIELSGHLPAQESSDSTALYAQSRIEDMLSQKRFTLKLSPYRSGYAGQINSSDYQCSMRDQGFRPETLMRRATLLDLLKQD